MSALQQQTIEKTAVSQIMDAAGHSAPAEAPAVLRPQISFDPDDLIEFNRRAIQHRNFTPLGRLAQIMLGDGAIQNSYSENPFLRKGPHGERPPIPALYWRNDGPLVARSTDGGGQYLLVGRTVHPPPLSDPNWKKPEIYGKPGTGNPRIPGAKRDGLLLKYKDVNGVKIPMLPEPPKIPQRLCDLCQIGEDATWIKKHGQWVPTQQWFHEGRNGEKWMLFQPVEQIVIHLFKSGGYAVIKCTHDWAGYTPCFRYDREREEGHILYASERCQEVFHL